jgi:hypothetical protein
VCTESQLYSKKHMYSTCPAYTACNTGHAGGWGRASYRNVANATGQQRRGPQKCKPLHLNHHQYHQRNEQDEGIGLGEPAQIEPVSAFIMEKVAAARPRPCSHSKSIELGGSGTMCSSSTPFIACQRRELVSIVHNGMWLQVQCKGRQQLCSLV